MPELSNENLTPAPQGPVGFIQKYGKYFLPALAVLAVIVAGALAAIFLLGRGGGQTFEGDARLTINVPNQSVSGSEISFEILIENISNTTLSEIRLDLFYPDTFQFTRAAPDAVASAGGEDDPPRFFSFDDLPAGQSHKLVVLGLLSGSVREIKIVKAVISYVPQNFQSTFKKESQAGVVMLAPNLSLNLRGPAQIYAGQTGTYTALMVNRSNETFTDITLRLEENPGFEYVSSAPDIADAGSAAAEWKILSIRPGEEREIVFSGRLSQTPTGEVLLRLEQFLPGLGGEPLSAGRSFVFTSVLASPLRLAASLNKVGFARSAYYEEGDGLEFEIKYENQGLTGLANVRLDLNFERDVFDFSRLRNIEGSGQRAGNSVAWIPGANPALRLLAPGQSGLFRFSLPIALDLKSRGIVNPAVKAELRYAADEFAEGVAAGAIEERIATRVLFEAAREDAGSAAEPTKYSIVFSLKNSVNDVAAAAVTARFPGLGTAIDFDSVAPVAEKNNFSVDGPSGVLRWDLGTVAAGATRQVSFFLSSSVDALLSDIVFSGTDVFTGRKITISASDLRK